MTILLQWHVHQPRHQAPLTPILTLYSAFMCGMLRRHPQAAVVSWLGIVGSTDNHNQYRTITNPSFLLPYHYRPHATKSATKYYSSSHHWNMYRLFDVLLTGFRVWAHICAQFATSLATTQIESPLFGFRRRCLQI